MKVTLSPKVREYIRREAKYLKSGSPRAAQQFADDIKRLGQGLSRFPEMGKFNDELPVLEFCALSWERISLITRYWATRFQFLRSDMAANVRRALRWTTISTSKNLEPILASSNPFSGGNCYLIPENRQYSNPPDCKSKAMK